MRRSAAAKRAARLATTQERRSDAATAAARGELIELLSSSSSESDEGNDDAAPKQQPQQQAKTEQFSDSGDDRGDDEMEAAAVQAPAQQMVVDTDDELEEPHLQPQQQPKHSQPEQQEERKDPQRGENGAVQWHASSSSDAMVDEQKESHRGDAAASSSSAAAASSQAAPAPLPSSLMSHRSTAAAAAASGRGGSRLKYCPVCATPAFNATRVCKREGCGWQFGARVMLDPAATPPQRSGSSKCCPFCSTLVPREARFCSEPKCAWDFSVELPPEAIARQPSHSVAAASSSPVPAAAASTAADWAALSELPSEVRDFAYALLKNIDPTELGNVLQQTPPTASAAASADASAAAASRKRRRDSDAAAVAGNQSPLSIIPEGSQEAALSQEPDGDADVAAAATTPTAAAASASAAPAILPRISMPPLPAGRAAASSDSSANSSKPQRNRVAPERYDGVSGFYMQSSVRFPFPSPRARDHGRFPFLWENEVDDAQPFSFLPVSASVMHPSTCHAPCAAVESAAEFSVGCNCPGGACRPDSCECAMGVQNQYSMSGLISGGRGNQRYGECWDKCSCACNSGRSVSASSTSARENVLSPSPTEHPLMTRRRNSQRSHASPSDAAASSAVAPGAASAASSCFNRVVQRGTASGGTNPELTLAVFRTNDGRGWGLKTLSAIKRHAFVCEYVGEVIHEYIAEARGARAARQKRMSYMMTPLYRPDEQVQPDFTPQARAAAAAAAAARAAASLSPQSDSSSSSPAAAAAPKRLPRDQQAVAPPAKKRRRGRPRKRPSSSDSDSSAAADDDSEVGSIINLLDFDSAFSDSASSDSEDEGRDANWQQSNEPYSIDASVIGNVARFANNSCTPNLLAVEVMIAHRDPRLPRVAFFAAKEIAPGTELTFHYGARHEGKEFDCICSPACVAKRDRRRRMERGEPEEGGPLSPRTPQILSPQQQQRTPTPGLLASSSGSARVRRTPVTPMSHLAESSAAIDAAEVAARQPRWAWEDEEDLTAAAAQTPRALKSLNASMEDVARPSQFSSSAAASAAAASASSFLSPVRWSSYSEHLGSVSSASSSSPMLRPTPSAKHERAGEHDTLGLAAWRRMPHYWRLKLGAYFLDASLPFPAPTALSNNGRGTMEARMVIRRQLIADLNLVEAEWDTQHMRELMARYVQRTNERAADAEATTEAEVSAAQRDGEDAFDAPDQRAAAAAVAAAAASSSASASASASVDAALLTLRRLPRHWRSKLEIYALDTRRPFPGFKPHESLGRASVESRQKRIDDLKLIQSHWGAPQIQQQMERFIKQTRARMGIAPMQDEDGDEEDAEPNQEQAAATPAAAAASAAVVTSERHTPLRDVRPAGTLLRGSPGLAAFSELSEYYRAKLCAHLLVPDAPFPVFDSRFPSDLIRLLLAEWETPLFRERLRQYAAQQQSSGMHQRAMDQLVKQLQKQKQKQKQQQGEQDSIDDDAAASASTSPRFGSYAEQQRLAQRLLRDKVRKEMQDRAAAVAASLAAASPPRALAGPPTLGMLAFDALPTAWRDHLASSVMAPHYTAAQPPHDEHSTSNMQLIVAELNTPRFAQHVRDYAATRTATAAMGAVSSSSPHLPPPVVLQLSDSSDDGGEQDSDDDDDLPPLVPISFVPRRRRTLTIPDSSAVSSAAEDPSAAGATNSASAVHWSASAASALVAPASTSASALPVPAPLPLASLSPLQLAVAASPVVQSASDAQAAFASAPIVAANVAATFALAAVASSDAAVAAAASSNAAAAAAPPAAAAAASSAATVSSDVPIAERKRCPFCSTLVPLSAGVCSNPRCRWDFSIELSSEVIAQQEAIAVQRQPAAAGASAAAAGAAALPVPDLPPSRADAMDDD